MTGSPRRLPINLLPRHGDAHGFLRRHEVIMVVLILGDRQ